MKRPLSRAQLALIGFVSHVPGLRFFAGASISAHALRLNLLFVGITLGAAAAAAWQFREHALGAAVAAWLVGHFAWSSTLAALVMRGHASFKSAD